MNPIPIPILVKAVARVVAIVGVLLAAFLVVPLRHDSTAVAGVTWAGLIALVALVAVFVHQTRRINHSRYPMMAGTESLIIVLALFIIGFAFVYVTMSLNAPDTFSEPLNRTGALYFAVTVLSTVGFGDITPKTDPSRWLVMAQMIIDLGLIAGALRLLFRVARRADERQRTAAPSD